MLAFNVAQLLKEGVGASRLRELSGELSQIDERNPGPVAVAGQVALVRTPAGVLVTGKADLELELLCRRCLEPVREALHLEIEEEYVPSIDILTGRPLPIEDGIGPELVIDERHTLDLTEVLVQYALARTMGSVLCSEDCKGLCPQCGANLNQGPCGCENVRQDPRLGVLATLLGSAEEDDDKTEEGEQG